MITKSQIQFVKSLQEKSERQKAKIFVGEGSRLVLHFPELVHILTKELLKKISSLISNEDVVAVFDYPKFHSDDFEDYHMSLYLEDIRDPGNMGTILRLADWYGIRKIYGTNTCVDVFNNKVIQASMSSIGRVEFQGLTDRLKTECNTLISISAQKSLGAESLNAAIASGIFLQHFS